VKVTVNALLQDIISKGAPPVSARVDACEIILAHGYESKADAVAFLFEVAAGQNPNADLTTRMRAIRVLVANKLETFEVVE